MRILLTEGSSTSAREAITALVLAGHEVAYCDPARICLGRFSRLVVRRYRCPPLGADPEGYRRFLSERLEEGHIDVLLPIHEQGCLVARIAAELRPHAALAAPSFDSYVPVLTKIGFSELLTELDLPQPRTLVLDEPRSILKRALPFVVKASLGTASRSTWLVRSEAERDDAMSEIARSVASGEPVVVQDWVDAPFEQAQAIFQAGRLVGFHATRRLLEGAGGGAALKQSVRRPRVLSDIARIGSHLAWHGALSVDYFIDESGECPLYIDGNPRLVEPMAAVLAGLNLADLLVQVSVGNVVTRLRTSRPNVRTRLSLQALLGTALRTRSRAAIARTAIDLLGRSGPFADTHEELTPVRLDPPSVLPVLAAALALLARPIAAQAMVRRGWGTHLLTPDVLRRIAAMVRE